MKNHLWTSIAALLVVAGGADRAVAQVSQKKSLDLDGARKIMSAAVAEAKRQKAGGAIAIVDDGGHLLLFERLDGTFAASARISIGKAKTAAMFKLPTRRFEETIGKGRTAMVSLEDFTPLQGGVPIEHDGQVLGAIGVSGAASAAADEEIALAGVEAVKGFVAGASTRTALEPVTHIEGRAVSAAFRKGAPLLEVESYKIHASRRDAAGQAEIHCRDTDVIHVLEGSATFVTGGTIVGGTTVATDEIRGESIRDGEVRRIVKGDVVVVPSGVPHWFKEVPEPITYYVVKVTAPPGGKQ